MSGHHKSWPKKDFPKPWTPKKFKPQPPALVTDHALVRYMERVMRIDVERLRGELIGDGRAALIRSMAPATCTCPKAPPWWCWTARWSACCAPTN